MPLGDDGDAVRALGFVAMYAAHLEEKIDDCLGQFIVRGHADERLKRRPASVKVQCLLKLLENHAPLPEAIAFLPPHLKYVADLLERRNHVIHGRVWADAHTGALTRKSAREDVPDDVVLSRDVYALADEIHAAQAELIRASLFRLPKVLGD